MPRAARSSAIDNIHSPSPDLIARFFADLERLWDGSLRADERLALAVSGGPDSLALLLLAHAALAGRIEAATVDHQLRAGSAAEAAMVSGVCERLGIRHAVLPVAVAEGNLQSEARTARYAALAGWMGERDLAALATAHHADDQAETLLMRLNRGSGVAGLAGVRAVGVVPGTRLPLLRPLLDWRRQELGGVVVAGALVAATDPSNANEKFDRIRVRQALGTADWLDPAALAQSAGHLADADAALDWAARREWSDQVAKEGLGLTYRPTAPRAIALRVLARIVVELTGEAPRGGAVARLFDSLTARQPASLGSLVARPLPSGWSFTRAPQRRA
jgi:tRNA(Ile)-lysidine synthase